jgi:hypothetical protein
MRESLPNVRIHPDERRAACDEIIDESYILVR